MESATQQSRRYRFGAFEIDLVEGELRRQGLRVKLNEKPFQVLALLLERAGHLVTREDLRQRLWAADTYVDFDANLNTALSTLRHALGDASDHPVFIETVPRQGYRFISPVTSMEESAVTAAANLEISTHKHVPMRNAAVENERRFSRLLPAVILLIILGCVSVWLAYSRWARRPQASADAGHKLTILVTPFENLSGDPSQEYLSDGLTDEMITRLGQTSPSHLSVIARSTAMQYKHTQKTLEQIAQEHHLDYVLEGSLRRQGDRVRITAQLFKAGEQTSLWTEAFERDTRDLLVIQRDVADRIAHSLSLEVLPTTAGTGTAANPPHSEAYDDYLKGLFELNKRTQEDLRRSITYFQQATAKDPNFAPAYAMLAVSYNVAGGWTFLPPGKAYASARAAAEKALALDNTLADAHSAYAEILHEYDWDWAGAEREYRRAVELNPSFAAGHKLYAEYLTHGGRFTEALDEIRKAQQLDPASLVMNAFVCFVYYHAREYDNAIRECNKVLELDPSFVPARYWRGATYVLGGRYDQALADFQKASELSENATYFQTWMAFTYALEGKRTQAREILKHLTQYGDRTYVSPYGMAAIYVGLGDREQALSLLQKACQERSADLVFLATAPEFDALRGEPRFQKMVDSIDFPISAISYTASSSQKK